MASNQNLKALVALHREQQRLFARTANGVVAALKKFPFTDKPVERVSKLVELLADQTTAFDSVLDRLKTVESASNRSAALMEPDGMPAFNFLTKRDAVAAHVQDMDEHNTALSSVVEIMGQAKPLKETNKKKWEEACESTWIISAFQSQMHALQRWSQGITATQEAILRQSGLKFWRGYKGHLRWEGDNRGA